jgi:hypothetical protein
LKRKASAEPAWLAELGRCVEQICRGLPLARRAALEDELLSYSVYGPAALAAAVDVKLHPAGREDQVEVLAPERTFLPGLEEEAEEGAEEGAAGRSRRMWAPGWARKTDSPVDAMTLPPISEELLSVVTESGGLEAWEGAEPELKEVGSGSSDEGAAEWTRGVGGSAAGRGAEEEKRALVERRRVISRLLGEDAGV